MSFIIKVISAMIIIVTVYVLWVFLLPEKTDEIAKSLWTSDINEKLRGLKEWWDNITDDMLQIKQAQETINQARQVKEVVNQKIDQTNKVIDQTNKVIDSTEQLRDDINALSSMSWASVKNSTGKTR